MNLSAVQPNTRRQPDARSLLVTIQEKDDIIHRLQEEQKLLKKALQDNGIKFQQNATEVEQLKQECLEAKKEAEHWKEQAFGCLQNQAVEIASTPEYKQLKKKLKSAELTHKRNLTDLRREYEETLTKEKEAIREQLTEEITKKLETNHENRINKFEKRVHEHEEKISNQAKEIEELKLQLEEFSKKEQEATSSIEILTAQLRLAEEHVLDQSNLYQQAFVELNQERERKENCKICKKLK